MQSVSLTTWSGGLGSWTADVHDVANAATFNTPDWSVTSDLPDNRAGSAAFVPNLDIGDCGADDQSGALSLDSPAISLPNNAEVPRISIEHWYETEAGWDGGNFKISVNGGPFTLIPASSIEYGSYGDSLLPPQDEFGSEYNSNPLAGQEAFTGTPDGQASGVWTESRINLLGIAEPGDTIRLRLDFGVDQCGGAVGWYVDTVEVYACADELPPSDCGNGVLDAGEQCDDGNDFVGDGCSNTCQVEAGWQCTDPEPPGMIGDPGFEAGTPNPAWDEQSNNPIGTPICEIDVCGTGGGSGPAEGDFWAWFGGVSNGTQEGALTQNVTFPATAQALTFQLQIPECDSAADYVELRIDGNLEWIANGTGGRCGLESYGTQTVDIADYANGASHEIQFHSETFANNGGVSNFFIDEVAMPGTPSVCTPAEPSLTLVKRVVNDDGGSAAPANWTLHATGPSSFSGPGPSVSSGSNFQPGTYHLSESGGPAGYLASGWNCEGGTQVDADTVTLAAGQSAVCTIVNNDFDTAFRINAGHSGAWYEPATSGQGFFIDIEPLSEFMFISWFTYTDSDSADPFEHRWFTAQGNYRRNRADLVLYETLGGKFDDPEDPTTTAVGTVTVTFGDCDHGEVAFEIEVEDGDESIQGTIPVERVIPGSGNVCQDLAGNATQAVDINAGMDGSWFEPATSGQGFFIDAYADPAGPNFIFLSWFTYGDRTESGQRWFTAQGQFQDASSSVTIDLNETTGGAFNAAEPTPSTERVGRLTLDFSDCSNALFSYSIPGEGLTGEIPVTRVIPGTEVLCEELSGTSQR